MSERVDDSKEFCSKVQFLVCGFGSLKWTIAARRLTRELNQFPFKVRVRTYTNRDLGNKFPKLLHFIDSNFGRKSRGFGYWIWKPYIINQVLSELEDGEILVYIDAGCEVIKKANSRAILENYVKYAQINDILAMELDASMHEYCEIQVARHFGLTSDQFNSLNMISATMLVLTGNPKSRKLVSDWLKCSLENPKLLSGDPTYFGHKGFVAHRHDQSILSALIHLEQIEPYANRIDYDPERGVFSDSLFHATRNKHFFSIMPQTLFGKLIRLRWWLYHRFNKEVSP